MGDYNYSKLAVDFLGVVRLHLSTKKFWNCRMWCTYSLLEEIYYMYLFWIDFDIIFFWNWKN